MPLQLPRERLVPLIVACGLFMENLDSTVLATALPAIAGSLDVNPLHLNLAITSYLFSLAVFIPVSGWVADRYGARTVFRSAIGVFTLGSILCGLSTSLGMLVMARMLQGLGGAMMVPVGRLVVLRTVQRSDLVRAMAWLTMPALIGPVLGPPLGGFITTYFHWRWIFYINVPIGILGIFLVGRFIEDIREQNVRPLDLKGFLLTAAALTGLVFGFETTGRGLVPGWGTIGLLVVGTIAAMAYVRHAARAENPIIDLRLLRIPTFRAAIVGGFLFRGGIGALPFLLPMMLQLGFGLNPLHSGLLTFASAAGALTMKLTAAPILATLGFRRVLIANALVSAAFVAACALFTPTSPPMVIFAVLLIGGFFRSLQFTSFNAIGYADVPDDRMSRATSFMSMGQQLSISFAVATGAMLLHLTLAARGSEVVGPGDFVPAFLVVAGVAACSALVCARLPVDAGAALAQGAGRRRAPAG